MPANTHHKKIFKKKGFPSGEGLKNVYECHKPFIVCLDDFYNYLILNYLRIYILDHSA